MIATLLLLGAGSLWGAGDDPGARQRGPPAGGRRVRGPGLRPGLRRQGPLRARGHRCGLPGHRDRGAPRADRVPRRTALVRVHRPRQAQRHPLQVRRRDPRPSRRGGAGALPGDDADLPRHGAALLRQLRPPRGHDPEHGLRRRRGRHGRDRAGGHRVHAPRLAPLPRRQPPLLVRHDERRAHRARRGHPRGGPPARADRRHRSPRRRRPRRRRGGGRRRRTAARGRGQAHLGPAPPDEAGGLRGPQRRPPGARGRPREVEDHAPLPDGPRTVQPRGDPGRHPPGGHLQGRPGRRASSTSRAARSWRGSRPADRSPTGSSSPPTAASPSSPARTAARLRARWTPSTWRPCAG